MQQERSHRNQTNNKRAAQPYHATSDILQVAAAWLLEKRHDKQSLSWSESHNALEITVWSSSRARRMSKLFGAFLCVPRRRFLRDDQNIVSRSSQQDRGSAAQDLNLRTVPHLAVLSSRTADYDSELEGQAGARAATIQVLLLITKL